MQGKAIDLDTIESFHARLTQSNHDFYAIKSELIDSLPEDIKLRLDPVKSFRQFSLFHAHPLEK